MIGTTTSSEDGSFLFDGLSEGVYQVLVELQGYQPALQQDARVARSKTAVYDFELVQFRISESVVVTAKARGDDPRAPVTRVSYDREQLRRSPGSAGDVFRALDSLPGVTATGEFSSFTVRGRGPRDNLILVDGIPFDKVVHFDQSIGEQEDIGGGGRFSIFAPNLIKEADFQPGGFSASYGGKNASLLRLEVAEGNRESASVSGRIEITGWEFNYDGPSYALDNTSLLLSARNQQFGRLFELIGEESIGSPSLTDIIFKSTTELGTKHRINVLGIYAPEEFQRDVENVLADEALDETDIARTQQDSTLLGVHWRYLSSDTSFWNNTFYYRRSDKSSIVGETFPELAPDGATPEQIPVRDDIFEQSEGESEVGWRGDYVHSRSNGGQLRVGGRLTRVSLDFSTVLNGDWIRYIYDVNDFRPDPSQKFLLLQPEFVNSAVRVDASRGAGYMEYSAPVGDSLTVTPGLRYEYEGFSEQSLWSPRINANVALNSETRLSLAGGVFYQYPSFLEVAADPANVKLENERAVQLLAGVNRFLSNDLRLSVETYYQSLDNLVVVPDRSNAVANNDGEGYAAGFDLLLASSPTRRLFWQTNYSYSHSRRDDNQGDGPYDSDFHRPHSFNLFFSYELNERWALGAKWKLASGRPTDAFLVHENVLGDSNVLRFSKEITEKNAQRLRSFQSLNVRVDYRRRVGPASLIFFLDFFNVYNYKNTSSLEWNERTGMPSEQGLDAFPTFGLKFEF